MSIATIRAEVEQLRAEMAPIEAQLSNIDAALLRRDQAAARYFPLQKLEDDEIANATAEGRERGPLTSGLNVALTAYTNAKEVADKLAGKREELQSTRQHQLAQMEALQERWLDAVYDEYRPTSRARLIAETAAARHRYQHLLGQIEGIADFARRGPRPGQSAAWYAVLAALKVVRTVGDLDAGEALLAEIEGGMVEHGEDPWLPRAVSEPRVTGASDAQAGSPDGHLGDPGKTAWEAEAGIAGGSESVGAAL